MSSITIRSVVVSAIRQGDMKRATDLARHALDEGQRDALFLNLRAQWLEEQGRDREALAELEAASQLDARDTGVLEALGLLRLRLGRARDAREAFERMLALAPSYAHAHFCVGLAHEALGDLDKAVLSFRTADGLEPGRAETLAHLASLAARSADWVEARRYADLALARDPNETDPKFVLATADLEAGEIQAAAKRLRPLANDGSLPPAVRATASSLLGDALDAEGNADEAFRAYDEASRHYVKAFGPLFPERAGAYAQVAALTEAFRAAPSAPAAPVSAAATGGETGHIFLIGFPRSGTTLLEHVLASHPNVATSEERDHLGEASELLAGERIVERIAGLTEADLVRLRRAYWASVADSGAAVAGRTFLDKLPLNTIKLPVIRRMFPAAKIVFALRDPRDVVFSAFRRRFAMNPSMYELVTLPGAARFYDAVMKLYQVYTDKLGIEPHAIRYEDVVRDLAGEMRRLCANVGLEWHESLGTVTPSPRTAATPSALQVKRGLYETGAGQWKRYERHLAPVMPALAPWVRRWGYDKAE